MASNAITYKEDFLSHFPNCQKLDDAATPRLCVISVYDIKNIDLAHDCRAGNCKNCWNKIKSKAAD